MGAGFELAIHGAYLQQYSEGLFDADQGTGEAELLDREEHHRYLLQDQQRFTAHTKQVPLYLQS